MSIILSIKLVSLQKKSENIRDEFKHLAVRLPMLPTVRLSPESVGLQQCLIKPTTVIDATETHLL